MGLFEHRQSEPTPQGQGLTVETKGCEHGLECLRDHFLRAQLYLLEAIRFSAEGVITDTARQKVRLARQQLLAEDDFQEALSIPPPLSYEVLRLLASTRSTWKAIERSRLDTDGGTVADLQTLADAVKRLVDKAYEITLKNQGVGHGQV